MIDIQNVNKSFKGSPAIQDLTLQVKEGEILGLLGVDIPVKLGSSSLLVKFHIWLLIRKIGMTKNWD